MSLVSLLSLSQLGACATAEGVGSIDPSLEMPRHKTLVSDGRIQIRRIDPMVAAETVVEGDYDSATRSAFRILAGYIFGANRAKQSIAMTAPVASTVEANERIAMTAPVLSVPAESTSETARWKTRFMMPSAYTRDTLPEPTDARVQFVDVPARCVAVMMFDGFTTTAAVEERTGDLRAWLKRQGKPSDGEMTLARYNDPFTLPWNRRNEVWIELSEQPCEAKTPT